MSKKRILLTTFVTLTVAVVVLEFLPNPIGLAFDVVRNLSTYTPTAVEEIISNLRLTDQGKFIFGAVNPQLETADVFNTSCTATESSISSLGCYDPNTQLIHIYLVESDELDGEMEATAAHELLHAAWDRLSNFERARLEPLLMEVYNSDEHHEVLAESTTNYTSNELLTELHSQIGERIKDLPPALEDHYARYFEDQDLVVSYFDAYSSIFEQLIADSESLSSEIEAERAALNKQADEYTAWLEDYNQRVQEFNSCARNPDCSLPNFTAQRNTLVSEGERIDAAYEAYESARAALNAKIDVYNSGVQHLQKLDYALDSRASPPEESAATKRQ